MVLDATLLINIAVGVISFLAGHAGLLTSILGLFNRPKSQPLTLKDLEDLLKQILSQNQAPPPPATR